MSVGVGGGIFLFLFSGFFPFFLFLFFLGFCFEESLFSLQAKKLEIGTKWTRSSTNWRSVSGGSNQVMHRNQPKVLFLGSKTWRSQHIFALTGIEWMRKIAFGNALLNSSLESHSVQLRAVDVRQGK